MKKNKYIVKEGSEMIRSKKDLDVPEAAIYSYFDSQEGIIFLDIIVDIFEKEKRNYQIYEILVWAKRVIDNNLVEKSVEELDAVLDKRKFWENALKNS